MFWDVVEHLLAIMARHTVPSPPQHEDPSCISHNGGLCGIQSYSRRNWMLRTPELQRHPRLRDQVYDALRELLRAGRLPRPAS